MPPRNKRNATASRRHHSSQQSPYPDAHPPDLLSFDPDAPPQTTYSSLSPAVFELEPPPSDPEVDRAPTLIRDGHDPPHIPHAVYSKHAYTTQNVESDIDDGGPVSPSTSPPRPSSFDIDPAFALAHAPSLGRSPAQLSIPEDSTSEESSLSRSIGHIRSPLLARDPTTLESFSRTIRNYVPSSIPIPSAAPSPPRISRPVSFGSFLSPSTHGVSPPVRERQREQEHEAEWRRRGSDTSSSTDQHSHWPAQRPSGSGGEMPVFSLDDDVPEEGPRDVTRYPGVGDTDSVLWAGWDTLANVCVSDGNGAAEHAKSRLVLMLGYPRGLQLWDCANLGSVSELLNLTGAQWGAVEYAAVLPDPPAIVDTFRAQRPMIGFLSRTARGTDFVVYSLRSHEVVKRLSLIGLSSFAVSSQLVILCTSNPSSLHIISSCTFATLYTIPSASLVAYTPPSSSVKPNDIHNVPHIDLDQHQHQHQHQHYSAFVAQSSQPRPIYTLSNRLLAYVSPLTRYDGTPSATPGQAHTSLPLPAAAQAASRSTADGGSRKIAGLNVGVNVTQEDLGKAAAKIGGSMLSGMKTLGGMAISAARAGVAAAAASAAGDQQPLGTSSSRPQAHSRSTSTSTPGTATGAFGMFFSKSAPAATSEYPHQYQTAADRRKSLRVVSSPVPTEGLGFDSQATVTPNASLPPPPTPTSPVSLTTGCNITVVDLRPLLEPSLSTSAQPETLAQFTFSRPQALSALKFSADGTSLAVCSKEGHAVRVLQLRPTPRVARPRQPLPPPTPTSLSTPVATGPSSAQQVRRSSSASSHAHDLEEAERLADSMQHMYTLRRGRTAAVVEGMAWAEDKLWFGMGTRKRTVHVFAINPLGGRPDGSSHLVGKVVNSPELVSTSTELSPLTRIRLKALPQDTPHVPCAFTFLRPSSTTIPASLLPPASVHFSASSSPSSVSSGLSNPKPVSPAQRPTRPTNYKDMLVFDPADGTLALHRIFVERPGQDQSKASSIPIPGPGGMSISLPGMSTLSRMSMSMGMGTGASPPSSGASPNTRAASGLTQMMERPGEIVGRESVVGTWALVRGRDWPEVRQSVRSRSGTNDAQRSAMGRVAKADYLSRAELSTFSPSPRILPRLIYLSHQFAFYALGEDYHALVRSYQFDVPSTKIEVRKPIAVSAFATGAGDSDAFVQDAHSMGLSSRSGVGPSSSFDEPLASALSAPLHPLNPSPPVLPMLPNGTPGSWNKGGLMQAIPIRHVAAGIQDGMTEGLGRIRRELGKARSPPQRARERERDGREGSIVTVPLEFEEEDEDFVVDVSGPTGPGGFGDELEADVLAGTPAPAQTAATPLANLEPLPAEHDGGGMWEGWGPEDKAAVEDAERFDDITVGFMDEEHESMIQRERERELGREGQALAGMSASMKRERKKDAMKRRRREGKM